MSRLLKKTALATLWLPAAALAQTAALPPAAAASAAEAPRPLLPDVKLPDLADLKAAVPRPVQAVSALMGLGTPRLALVVGNSLLGSETALGAAPRDTQAVAAALRAGGFVVMVREDLGLDDLRANLKEFHDRLQPDSVGLLYFTGLGLQLDGQNLLLPRGPRPAGGSAGLKAAALPLQELIDAVQGTERSPRFLVVDAAFSHEALAGLPKPGLAQQRLPPGMMALFSSAPDAVLAPPAAPTAAAPASNDPRQIAATPFARELVRSLLTPRRSGAEVLRATRSGVLEASQGQQSPWIEGDNTDKSDLAEPDLLDALLPRTPQELARDAARLALRVSPERSAAAAAAQAGEALTPIAGSAPAPLPPGPPGAAANAAATAATTAAGVAGTAATVAAGTAVSAGTGAAAAVATAAAGAAASLISSAGDMPVSAFASPPPPPPKPVHPPPPAPAPAPPPQVATTTPAATLTTARSPAERPAWTPRVNPFGYAEGDTYTYRVLDKWKNEVSGLLVQAIEEVLPDGQMRANGAATQFDAQGRIKSTRNADGSRSDYEPAQELYWPNPRRGEKRSVDFGENFQRADRSRGHTEWTGSMSVGRATKIQLPAGEFEVVPIEGSGWYHTKSSIGGFSGQWSRTVWYSTKLGHPVAIDVEDADRTGRLLRRERVELVHAQTQRGSH